MTPFLKISDACRETGLSTYFLRKGCKDRTIPHIRSGTVYLIDVAALLAKLHSAAEMNSRDKGVTASGEAEVHSAF